MYRIPSRSGNTVFDNMFQHLVDYINRQEFGGGSSSSTTNNKYIINEWGGFAILVENVSGVKLLNGYTATNGGGINQVDIAAVDAYYLSGIIYKDIPAYGSGYMTIIGPCDVYFNDNGSTAGQYFRIATSRDPGTLGSGKAQSSDRLDNARTGGTIDETRSGEGLAMCLLRR